MNREMERELLLSVEGLNVTYVSDEETVRAINGVTLQVHKGESLGIVGETGAGKTTLALSILRLLPKEAGRINGGTISFGEVDILSAPEAVMRSIRGAQISMIFQDPMTSLNPVLTVADQIGEVLTQHTGMNKAQVAERTDEILSMVGIDPQRKVNYPHQFSGGMKQRVIIAMALACEPDLLIADEPTTALDVTIQAQVLQMMDALKQKLNTAMILITHDLGVVAESCDRVAIMYGGKIVETGKIVDVFDDEKRHHPYTIGLFQSIPDLTQNTRRLTPIEGLMPDPTNLPQGCYFHPRCQYATAACEEGEIPEFVDGDHRILCGQLDRQKGGNGSE